MTAVSHRAGARVGLAAAVFLFLLTTAACSLPNLESPECTAARGAVVAFYSFHFDGDMSFSPENLEARRRFLTPEFYQALSGVGTIGDVFTSGDTDFPKAFRVGACSTPTSPGAAEVEVLLLWRSDKRSEERRINVTVVNREGKWLIDKIVRP